MTDKLFQPISGYIMLLVAIACLVAAFLLGFLGQSPILFGLAIMAFLFIVPGFFTINPNGSKVLVLFGKYIGTVKRNGFFWAIPFYARRPISLRARNFDSERVKVNDRRGNPIMISVILVWRVTDSFKAAFDVDDYEKFVRVQTDAAVRKLASMYSYDQFEDHEEEITLRSNFEEVNEALEQEIQERLNIAGIEVMEARIGYLAYAEEIAQAMLKRQQAEAIVSARHKIVGGAVSMVESALETLSQKQIVDLDGDQKAAMVSNLMVILCSDKEASPVVNAGTLHH